MKFSLCKGYSLNSFSESDVSMVHELGSIQRSSVTCVLVAVW